MQFEYTRYKYNRPELLTENEYEIIKHKLSSDPSFYPYNSNSFLQKYKVIFLTYGISGILGPLLASIENEILNFIVMFGGIILLFLSFSLVPEIISYAIVMVRRRIYYKLSI